MTLALTISSASSLLDLDSTFLPTGEMRQITRVTALQDGRIEGEVDIGMEHWVYPQHFPGDPIFPGSLIIEAAGQLVALWAWAQGQRGRPRLVRTGAEFRQPVDQATPGLVLRGEVRRKRHLFFGTVEVTASDVHVASVTAVLAVVPA